MTEAEGADAMAAFDPLRPRPTRVAYRMLGSVAAPHAHGPTGKRIKPAAG